MTTEERPLVGVRGEQKDMKRIAKLIAQKNEAKGEPHKPVTIVLIDDKDTDGWGQCQTNERRCLALVPAYSAFPKTKFPDVVAEMNRTCPSELLTKFYHAFRDCDMSHGTLHRLPMNWLCAFV
jgi:hypothetical protein